LKSFYAGFRPCRRVPFVSAKGTKTIFARARPLWGPWSTTPNQDGCATRSAQTVLAEGVDSGQRPSRAQRVERQRIGTTNDKNGKAGNVQVAEKL